MSRVTGARCDECGKVAGGVGNWSSVWRALKVRGVLIEDKASGTGLIQSLRRDEALRDMPIIPVQRNTDKVSRVNDVLPFLRAGRLFVPESAPWLPRTLVNLPPSVRQ